MQMQTQLEFVLLHVTHVPRLTQQEHKFGSRLIACMRPWKPSCAVCSLSCSMQTYVWELMNKKRPCIADPYLSQPGKPWPWLLSFDGNRWQDFQLQLHVVGLFTCPFLNKALQGTAQSVVLNWPTRFMNFWWTVSWFLYISESGLQ